MDSYIFSILIVAAIVCAVFLLNTKKVYADQGGKVNIRLKVDDKEEQVIKAYYVSYAYNTYISLEDLAYVLKDTRKAFDIKRDQDGTWMILTGKNYTGKNLDIFKVESYKDPTSWDNISYDRYKVMIDGKERQILLYDNYTYSEFNGTEKGVYMRLMDLGLFMNMAFKYNGYNEISINTDEDFVINKEDLEEYGYFHDLDGVLLGDVTTGEIIYAYDENHPTEIASTSKIMTFLLTLEEIRNGKLKEDDNFTITQTVYNEALSEDGTLYEDNKDTGRVMMRVGQTWSIKDLMAATMLPSANEAATALAEAIAGSEKEFVKLMNNKAKELNMTTAKFYNPHGLPHYKDSQFAGKLQNRMSAADMFKMVTYLIKNYKEQSTEITSHDRIYLKSLLDDEYTYTKEDGTKVYTKFGADDGYIPYVNSTFTTLHKNIDGLLGIKTGTTNRAGACMVGAIDVNIKGEIHTLVSVSFGGEDNRQRVESSTVLLKYGRQWAKDKK